MNDIMTKEEVADILDCEPTTVEDKARSGELPAVKYGRGWIIPRTALLEHLHAKAMENVKPKGASQAAPLAVATKTAKRAPPPLPAM